MKTSHNQDLINATNISIGYHGRTIGNNISFSLHASEVLCVLGPNGSGKSTLFKSLLGLLPLLGGNIAINGVAIKKWVRTSLARFIAYVPQAQDAPFPFLVKDIALMGRYAHVGSLSAPRPIDLEFALQCLEDLGIAHLQNRLYTEISGGERQLVLIARALAQEPKAIIMDEPTASLDFGNQALVLKVIQNLRELGLGVLFCTHQPKHAIRVADRVALFEGGRVHSIGSSKSVLSVASLAALYNMDELTVKWLLDSSINLK